MEKPPTSLSWRILRAVLVFILFSGILLGVGSYYMRRKIIALLKSRVINTSSQIITRPFALSQGVSVKGSRLYARLDRLGYQKVDFTPERPGQFQTIPGKLVIMLRGGLLPDGTAQSEQLTEVLIDGQGEIDSVIDAKYRKKIPVAYLEPELLSILGDSETRASIPKGLDEFSPLLIKALLAIEDERFYSHFGIDPLSVSRAVFVNLKSGRALQGGSTLTQQLAKNLLLTNERNLSRKVMEAFSAILLETSFTKDQILELYLNEVFLSQEGSVALHGFGEASKSFFAKDVCDLTLAEAATLAGLVKAPTSYSPRHNPEKAHERRRIVLQRMLELGYINESEAKKAAEVEMKVQPAQRTRRPAPYFVDYIRKQVEAALQQNQLTTQALRIFTPLDLEYQACANEAIQKGLEKLDRRTKVKGKPKTGSPLQAALVSVDPSNGEILAWVGGRDYSANQFDRVSQAKRQPGSAFKPFVYLTALDAELNTYRVAKTTTTLMDEAISINVPGGTWEPKNYDGKFRGEVTVRESLTHSLNVPTIELAQKVGIESVARTAELFGFGQGLPRVPSLALGAGEVTPLEMARAYTAIADGGLLMYLRAIITVSDGSQNPPLLESRQTEQRAALEPAVFVLTSLLQSVVESGTGKVIRQLGFMDPAAGKTGTTNDTRDAWFVGFTPKLLTAIWVGYDDNRKTGLTGGSAAAPIWAEYMKCAAPLGPRLDFIAPPGTVFRKIDRNTGLLYRESCSGAEAMTEVFVQGTEPETYCDESSVRDGGDNLIGDDSLQRGARPSEEAELNDTDPERNPDEIAQEEFGVRLR